MNIAELRTNTRKTTKPRSNLIFSIKKVKNQKKWTKEEDELLVALAEKYNEKHWKEISKKFFKKNSLQCFSRYKRIRPGIIKGSWKKEEDLRILDLVNRHGKSWSKISKIIGTRNGKQIRDRYINVLDPEIKKGKFTDDEDRKLILLFQKNGPKWATIAKYYPNRTADMIKNRFHSSIKKKLNLEGIPENKLFSKEFRDEMYLSTRIESPADDPNKNLCVSNIFSSTYSKCPTNVMNNNFNFTINPTIRCESENPNISENNQVSESSRANNNIVYLNESKNNININISKSSSSKENSNPNIISNNIYNSKSFNESIPSVTNIILNKNINYLHLNSFAGNKANDWNNSGLNNPNTNINNNSNNKYKQMSNFSTNMNLNNNNNNNNKNNNANASNYGSAMNQTYFVPSSDISNSKSLIKPPQVKNKQNSNESKDKYLIKNLVSSIPEMSHYQGRNGEIKAKKPRDQKMDLDNDNCDKNLNSTITSNESDNEDDDNSNKLSQKVKQNKNENNINNNPNTNLNSNLYSKNNNDNNNNNNNNNEFNYDMLNLDLEINGEDSVYSNGNYLWNFDDYFTI